MRVIDCDQGSAQWLEARRGKITASRIADVLSVLKRGGESSERRNYRVELIAERLSGRAEDHYTSPEMVWGTEYEAFARTEYEMATGVMVDTVGFILHPTIDYAGASPDGLIGADGGLEIKCPKTTTHIKWILAGGLPEEHEAQCLWNMACAGRSWWDFASYDPRLPDGLKLFTVRMHRHDSRIALIEEEVCRFNAEVDSVCGQLRGLVKDRPQVPGDTRSEFDQLMAVMDRMEITP